MDRPASAPRDAAIVLQPLVVDAIAVDDTTPPNSRPHGYDVEKNATYERHPKVDVGLGRSSALSNGVRSVTLSITPEEQKMKRDTAVDAQRVQSLVDAGRYAEASVEYASLLDRAPDQDLFRRQRALMHYMLHERWSPLSPRIKRIFSGSLDNTTPPDKVSSFLPVNSQVVSDLRSQLHQFAETLKGEELNFALHFCNQLIHAILPTSVDGIAPALFQTYDSEVDNLIIDSLTLEKSLVLPHSVFDGHDARADSWLPMAHLTASECHVAEKKRIDERFAILAIDFAEEHNYVAAARLGSLANIPIAAWERNAQMINNPVPHNVYSDPGARFCLEQARALVSSSQYFSTCFDLFVVECGNLREHLLMQRLSELNNRSEAARTALKSLFQGVHQLRKSQTAHDAACAREVLFHVWQSHPTSPLIVRRYLDAHRRVLLISILDTLVSIGEQVRGTCSNLAKSLGIALPSSNSNVIELNEATRHESATSSVRFAAVHALLDENQLNGAIDLLQRLDSDVSLTPGERVCVDVHLEAAMHAVHCENAINTNHEEALIHAIAAHSSLPDIAFYAKLMHRAARMRFQGEAFQYSFGRALTEIDQGIESPSISALLDHAEKLAPTPEYAQQAATLSEAVRCWMVAEALLGSNDRCISALKCALHQLQRAVELQPQQVRFSKRRDDIEELLELQRQEAYKLLEEVRVSLEKDRSPRLVLSKLAKARTILVAPRDVFASLPSDARIEEDDNAAEVIDTLEAAALRSAEQEEESLLYYVEARALLDDDDGDEEQALMLLKTALSLRPSGEINNFQSKAQQRDLESRRAIDRLNNAKLLEGASDWEALTSETAATSWTGVRLGRRSLWQLRELRAHAQVEQANVTRKKRIVHEIETALQNSDMETLESVGKLARRWFDHDTDVIQLCDEIDKMRTLNTM